MLSRSARDRKPVLDTGDTIVPEYVPPWDEHVESLLARRMSDEERSAFQEDMLRQFDEGMCKSQESQSMLWMNSCVDATGFSKTEVASRMNVDRGHFGRWLTGENDIPYQRLQRFYVLFGLTSNQGSPLKDRETLNLGGYLSAMAFVRCKLGIQVNEGDHQPLPTLETMLQVYHFYANMEPLKKMMDARNAFSHLAESVLDDAKEFIGRFASSNSVRNMTTKDLSRTLTTWGVPWLICLRTLAEEEDGRTAYFISARRPIRLPPLVRAHDGRR